MKINSMVSKVWTVVNTWATKQPASLVEPASAQEPGGQTSGHKHSLLITFLVLVQKSGKSSLLVSVLNLPGREKKFLGCWVGCSGSEKRGRGGCRWGRKMQQVRLILKQPECPHCLSLGPPSVLGGCCGVLFFSTASYDAHLGLPSSSVSQSLSFHMYFFPLFSVLCPSFLLLPSAFCLCLRSCWALYSVILDSLKRTGRGTEGQIPPLQHPKLC